MIFLIFKQHIVFVLFPMKHRNKQWKARLAQAKLISNSISNIKFWEQNGIVQSRGEQTWWPNSRMDKQKKSCEYNCIVSFQDCHCANCKLSSQYLVVNISHLGKTTLAIKRGKNLLERQLYFSIFNSLKFYLPSHGPFSCILQMNQHHQLKIKLPFLRVG